MTTSVSRRSLLRAALLVPAAPALTGALLHGTAAASPGLLQARPQLTHGVATGDPRTDGVLVWARSDVPATMIVETSATESFANPVAVRGPLLTPATDGTGRLRLHGLEPGAQVHYRVTLEGEDGARSEALTGMFTTAPATRKDISFVWSGDVAGQGWGINADTGGMTVWSVMADRRPDFFIHSGDAIYADNPIEETQKQNDGRIYRNITSPDKAQVAQTLDQFRGNYRYNLLDSNYRYFNSVVPQIIQWDDHEVMNNWSPSTDLSASQRYTDTMSANAERVLRRAHTALVGAEAAAATAPLIVRHVMRRQPVTNGDTLRQVGDALALLLGAYIEKVNPKADDRALIRWETARLWGRIGQTALRSGAVGIAAALANRPDHLGLGYAGIDSLMAGRLIGSLRNLTKRPRAS